MDQYFYEGNSSSENEEEKVSFVIKVLMQKVLTFIKVFMHIVITLLLPNLRVCCIETVTPRSCVWMTNYGNTLPCFATS